MEYLIRVGRSFYGMGIAGIGILQFIFSDFRPMILPLSLWPSSVTALSVSAYISGAVLIIAGVFIIFSKRARMISLGLGILFFLLFLCFQVYDQLFLSPFSFHLGLWTNALKELAFSGGAFIVAVSFTEEKSMAGNKMFFVIGRVFFSIMLIAFGIDHFLYTEFVATLVPSWISGHTFWTYFSGVALAGSGVCILLKIKIRLVATLLGIMLFLWLIVLHIPRAIADPNMEKGNEITSVFQALTFSGIAFLLSALSWNELVNKRTKHPNKFD